MEICIAAEGATYDVESALARCAEDCGFAGYFRADHLMRAGTDDPAALATDVWVSMAGLARETQRLRLGSVMTCSTFRYPAHLAVIVAQVDAMSGGRIELGIGAGSSPAEHVALGIPLDGMGTRFDRLEEQLELIKAIWSYAARRRARLRWGPLPDPGISRAGGAVAVAVSADHHRRARSEANAPAGRSVRRRVQHRLGYARGGCGRLRARRWRLRSGWTRSQEPRPFGISRPVLCNQRPRAAAPPRSDQPWYGGGRGAGNGRRRARQATAGSLTASASSWRWACPGSTLRSTT